jgi:hypothetical protein
VVDIATPRKCVDLTKTRGRKVTEPKVSQSFQLERLQVQSGTFLDGMINVTVSIVKSRRRQKQETNASLGGQVGRFRRKNLSYLPEHTVKERAIPRWSAACRGGNPSLWAEPDAG